MRILLLHNRYRQAGGEDVVVARERALLAAHGHDVRLYQVSNKALRGGWESVRAMCLAPYSPASRRLIEDEIVRTRPDIVHVHNFFPRLTPSIFDACRAARVAVVQTVHNYRLVCLNAVCFRNGRACDDCLGRRLPWPGVLHGCYRGSRAASAGVGAMLALHRMRGTWHDKVDLYIVPTAFVRDKLVQGGFPSGKIVVKPHFVDPDPGPGAGRGGYALYVGRLSPEKGVDVLLSAWRGLGPGLPLKIVGAAAEACPPPALERGRHGSVEWLGAQPHERIQALMRRAYVLVFPSLCYETFGLVIAEAYAAGLPVIGADLGTVAAMVEDGVTGLRFRPGDAGDLAVKAAWLWRHPGERAAMARAARSQFESSYTAVRGYRSLLGAYARARETAACAA